MFGAPCTGFDHRGAIRGFVVGGDWQGLNDVWSRNMSLSDVWLGAGVWEYSTTVRDVL